MHFIVSLFDDINLESISSKEKLLDNLLGFCIISEIGSIPFFIGQTQEDCLLFLSYFINSQLFSHKDKLFCLNSSFLSFKIISVPLSVV